MPLDQFDARVAEQLQVDAVEPVNFAVFGRDQGGPVEPDLTHLPAVACGVFELFTKVRGIRKELLGYATTNHAGATHPALFANADAGTVFGRNACRPNPTGSGANHEEVEIVLAHHVRSRRKGASSRQEKDSAGRDSFTLERPRSVYMRAILTWINSGFITAWTCRRPSPTIAPNSLISNA